MSRTQAGPAISPQAGPPPQPATRQGGDRRWTWAAVGATVLAAAVGLVGIGSKGLTYDEAHTIGFVHGPLSSTWSRIVSFELNQAPYYLLFSAWYELGQSLVVMRLLSLAFAVATVPVVFALGRRLFGPRAATLAAVLLGLHGLVVAWAQQLRSYSMVLFLVTVASYLLVRAVERPDSTRRALAYVAVAALGVYAHFYVALVVAAHGLSLLALRPRPRALLRTGSVAIAVLLVPVAAYLVTRNGDPLNFLGRLSPWNLLLMAGDVAGGGLEQLAALGGAAVLGVIVTWRLVRQRTWTREAWGHVMAVLWLVLPPAVVLVSTYTVKPLLESRYLIVIVPALVLVAAVGVTRIADRRLAATAAAVVVVASALGVLQWYRASANQDWRVTTEAVLVGAEPGDAIVVVPGQARPAVEYYLRRLDGLDLPVLQPSADDPPVPGTVWEVERDFPGRLDWNPMPTYDEWRDRFYVLAEERPVAPKTVLRRFERRP